jgi:spore coat protein A, manganese oxidase
MFSMMDRRSFIKLTGLVSAGFAIPRGLRRPLFVPLAAGLSDPALQPKFMNPVPNALDPSFRFAPTQGNSFYDVGVSQATQYTGLVGSDGITPVPTEIWGYGQPGGTPTWPGRTFEVHSGKVIKVRWTNDLVDTGGSPLPHLLPVDPSLHWAYSLPGYDHYSIEDDGVPIVTHLHGGHTNYLFDGNPEYFFSPGFKIKGPRWSGKTYVYHNDQRAGNLWYHDHALGLTRLNVYAGLAGFYFVRDGYDTGNANNPLQLPAVPYELAYAIQDRMFRDTGELFYPAFPGDPAWDDFITDEGVEVCDAMGNPQPCVTPPSALAEFFGDHMLVNGVIWPRAEVEPRHYRIHLLNGCDSRFMAVQFRTAANPMSTDLSGAGPPLPYYVIGSDQGLGSAAIQVDDFLLFEPGSRYDLVFDFSQVPAGTRVIMTNIAGDAPFGGDVPADPADLFQDRQTDRIMAFDVNQPQSDVADTFDPELIGQYRGNTRTATKTRKVALFEGKDEFGRLQPLLGAWIDGEWKALPWHSPTTENPRKNATEIWEIYNFTGDAHPVHLHLVHFDILGRNEISFDDSGPPQQILQHNGLYGIAPSIADLVVGAPVNLGPSEGYVENAPKDMVTALPEQVTRIKATFDKPGRYVWHCHILSHEDHEMMRVLHVGGGA